jgi:hypothetical protein
MSGLRVRRSTLSLYPWTSGDNVSFVSALHVMIPLPGVSVLRESLTFAVLGPFPPEQLAQRRPALKRTLIVVFIANEENSSTQGIGVDALMAAGKLDDVKNGPLFWVSRDKNGCYDMI